MEEEMSMRVLGRPVFVVLVLILAGVLLLSLRGATLAYSSYFGPTSLSSNLMSYTYSRSIAPVQNTSHSPAALSNAADFQRYAGLPATFSLATAYYLNGGSAYTIPVNVDPSSVVVYKIGADGTLSQFFDVSFDASGRLLLSTAGEVAPATYLVGTSKLL